MSKEKTYEFSLKGFEKAKADAKIERISKYMNIAMWSIIGGLVFGGVITQYGLYKMLACTGTSKVVKILVNLK